MLAMATKKPLTLDRTWPYILTIGGLIGFVAAFELTLDKIQLLMDPNFVPNCNLSPLISCGSVIKTHQAAVAGFPNSLMGIFGFAIVVTIGMALLAGLEQRQLKRWFWLGLETGTILAVGLLTWLQYQSIFTIRALCPWCMVVWSITIPIFWYTTLMNLRTGVIATPVSLEKFVAFLQRHHGDILFSWYAIIILIILNHFWYYWKTLI
jgi:uncharacterized membrane protein